MLARFVGQPRWSLATWLALCQPYFIVDEAHNTKTERSFEALKRVNPALILALTATPVPKRSVVLFHVTAQQLQAGHMIKMPISLIEHRHSAGISVTFDPSVYPVAGNKRYRGKFCFSKHFYPVLADLADGSEEWRCAMALDDHALVRFWVRNPDSDPMAGFWLPTSLRHFYPDFVCQRHDGRLLVAE